MRVLFLLVSLLSTTAVAAFEDPVRCDASDITVRFADAELAASICEVAARTRSIFQRCNVPPIVGTLRIDVVQDLPDQCVGVYHCGKGYVEVLSPKSMEIRRNGEGAFSFLPRDRFFASIITHELAHAALDTVPCPYDTCVVGNEYVAYAMQVMSLTPDERQSFVDLAGIDREIHRDELGAMLFYMAPHVFAQKAWSHLNQRDDPCGFIGQITDGSVILDFDIFQ